MAPKIHIDQEVKLPLFYNAEEVISWLLTFVPPEDLIGLDSIALVRKFKTKEHRNSGAFYHQRHRKIYPPYIQISYDRVYNRPGKFVCYLLPNLVKYALSEPLFHEIGHHVHYSFKRGKTRIAGEKFAEKYSEKYGREVLRQIITKNRLTKQWYRLVFFFLKKIYRDEYENGVYVGSKAKQKQPPAGRG